MPVMAPSERVESRFPDTKAARFSASAARKSGNRDAGYVRSASSVPTNVPLAAGNPVLYARPVPTPDRSVPQRELLSARAVPKRLSKEVVHRVARPVVHDRIGPKDDRVAGPDRADVQVDVFGRDEPLVEAADLIEDGLPIGEIGRRIRDVRSLDDEFHPLELLERPIADLDRPSGDDVMMPQAIPKLSDPA